MFKKLITYLLQGILYAVPLAVTLFILFKLIRWLDNIIPINYPGMGLLALVTSLVFIGFLGSTIIAAPIIRYWKKVLDKAPLVKTIYSAIKDLVSAFVGKKKTFDTPVLVKLSSESNIEKFGFITNKDLSALNIGPEKIAVYLPHSYAFSGNLFVVEKANVTPLEASSADVMKFIVSGGVANINQEKMEP